MKEKKLSQSNHDYYEGISYIDYNGKSYTNFLNIMYKKHPNKNTEEIFLFEKSLKNPPFCSIKGCKNYTSFLSLNKGYRKFCKEHGKKFLHTRKLNIDDFWDFYYNNLNLYSYYSIKSKEKNVIEPFLNLNTGKFSIYTKIKKYFGKENFPNKRVCCVFCKEESIFDFFDDECYCKSKSCRRYKKQDYINYFERYRNNETFICPETNKIFYNDKKPTKIENEFSYHVKQYLGYNILDYFKNYSPNILRECLNQNCKKIIIPHYNPFNPYKKHDKKFCSHQCYFNYRKETGDNLKNITNQSKKKQSKTMKKKIFDGEFTPKSNNRKKPRRGLYRSSWEYYFHLAYPWLKFEHTRISYNDKEGKKRIYICDFTDTFNNIIYEIKPHEVIEENEKRKFEAAINFCEEWGYEFKLITQKELYFILTELNIENLKNEDIEKYNHLIRILYHGKNQQNKT